jgi:hypothetical protein
MFLKLILFALANIIPYKKEKSDFWHCSGFVNLTRHLTTAACLGACWCFKCFLVGLNSTLILIYFNWTCVFNLPFKALPTNHLLRSFLICKQISSVSFHRYLFFHILLMLFSMLSCQICRSPILFNSSPNFSAHFPKLIYLPFITLLLILPSPSAKFLASILQQKQ